MHRDVLVVMDRGEASVDALEYALAEYPSATVHVVHVTEENDPLDLFGTHEPAEYMIPECDVELDDELIPDGNSFNRCQRERAEAVLDRACAIAAEHGREIEPVVRSGTTAAEVTDCAEALAVGHIVLPERCRSAVRPIVRSVPEAVARRASRPVTIVS